MFFYPKSLYSFCITSSCIIKCLLVFFIFNCNSYSITPNTVQNSGNKAVVKTKITNLLDHGAQFLYKPDSFKMDMDSARANFDKAFAWSTTIKDEDLIHKCIVYYGEVLFEENKYPEAIANFNKVITYYQNTKQFKKEAKLWEILGKRLFWRSPRNFNTLEESVKCFDKVALIYEKLGFTENLAAINKNKADAHLNQGRLDLAEKELLDVLALYNKIGYKKVHFTYDLLADTQRLKGDLGKNLYYCLLCVKSMETTGDFGYALVFYKQLAAAYKELGSHELSIEFLRKSISYLNKKEVDYSNLYESIDLLCKELIALKRNKEALNQVLKTIKEYPPQKNADRARIYGSLAYCYDKNNQTNLAETNYLKMINLYEDTPSTMYIIDLSVAYFEIGKFYQEHKAYEKAKIYFHKSLNFSKGIVELSQIKDANLYLFKIDSVKGNYFSAIKYFQKYKDLNDSIFNEKKNKQIEELQVLYGLTKKEKEFSNLKLAMDVEKGKTNQAESAIKFGIIIVLMLLLSTILFWRSYQSKQNNNQLLLSQKNEIDQKNNVLQKLVNEKEALMQEIHHRVKNNLQIVMSLLNSQSATLKNEEAFDAIQKSQHRLYAISLLHQKLYKTDIVREIEMENYINDLLCNFRDTFDIQDRIDFELDLNSIFLDEAQAVSVGLILNETVTNAIKHGFPEHRKGTISIIMKLKKDNKIILQISDNGIGFPKDCNFEAFSTLGVNLINGLAQQLDGQVSFLNNNGAVIRIMFTRNLIS